MRNDALVTRIRKTLDRPDTIILIGSGISLWSGLPSWPKLLFKLADFVQELGRDASAVREEIEHGDLLLAASYAVHQLGHREFGQFIRMTINAANAVPSEIHRLISTLGPSSYITTNYDAVLETALEMWGPSGKPRIVTNRQLTEIADIIPSSSRNFVFKYHGDINDAASIVLTRDQYRHIQLEYPATVRALSTLLATRPVVMFGFGLRDLDFLAVKDDLVAAFEGQAGEYFAIMPDFDQVRSEYWRRVYRTEILSYDTIELPDGTRDHRHLQDILKRLQPAKATNLSQVTNLQAPNEAEKVLLLARLAARIVREKPNTEQDELPLTVSQTPDKEGHYRFFPSKLNDLLRQSSESLLLLGLPGAGKSFALKTYAAEVASKLLEASIDAGNISPETNVPILVNLALYSGSLENLLQDSLPTGLDLQSLLNDSACTVILDSANEAPRDFIENEVLVNEILEFINRNTQCRVIVSSRNEGWLGPISLPSFTISDIDDEYVIEHFSSRTTPEHVRNPELIQTLSKPLFFSLARNGIVKLEEISTPADIYSRFFERVSQAWLKRSTRAINFATTLKNIGLQMLANGTEYVPADQFQSSLKQAGLSDSEHQEAISFLLSENVLIAFSGQRLSFFHQSVAEYLAANVIAAEYSNDQTTIIPRLQDKRWDQAIFLAMAYLNKKTRSVFLETIIAADIVAATRAVFYVEQGQSEIINKILKKVTTERHDFQTRMTLSFQIERLPYNKKNIPLLELIARTNDGLGGSAMGAVFKLQRLSHKSILDSLLKRPIDFNYASSFVRYSAPSWTADDLDYLFKKLKRITKNIEPRKDFIEGLGGLLGERLGPDQLTRLAQDSRSQTSAAKYALMEAFENSDTAAARDWLLELVCKGESDAFFSLYLNLRTYKERIPTSEILPNMKLAEKLVSLFSAKNGEWAFKLAEALIDLNAEWAPLFKTLDLKSASQKLVRDILISPEGDFFSIIRPAIERPNRYQRNCIAIVGHSDHWRSAPISIVMDVLETRHAPFAGDILSQIQGKKLPLSKLRPLHWWLNWATECLRSKNRDIWWCGVMLCGFLGRSDDATRTQILEKLNCSSAREFKRLGGLLYFSHNDPKFTTDELSEVVLNRLLNDGSQYTFAGAALGNAATESFAYNVLVPSLRVVPERPWIREALTRAGERHNKRYLVGE